MGRHRIGLDRTEGFLFRGQHACGVLAAADEQRGGEAQVDQQFQLRGGAPVILSHGACRALLNHPRAATDRMIKLMKRRALDWYNDESRWEELFEKYPGKRPAEARERFAVLPEAELIAVPGGKHLWVGEAQTRQVLTEIVRAANPAALPLPTEWPA